MVCRSLGFPGAWDYSTSAAFGGGEGLIWLDEVNCNGTEPYIQACEHSSFGIHNCAHREDARVSCIGNNLNTLTVAWSTCIRETIETYNWID